jgi:low temperature requirement protein LtrA
VTASRSLVSDDPDEYTTALLLLHHSTTRWTDHQSHPHTNWGDIFFDLFYVAAAYNLGNVLREDPTPRGFLYLIAMFLPIMNLWHLKVYYDSRFYLNDDVFHRLYEVLVLVSLASACRSIRPYSISNDLKHNIDLFNCK